MLELKIEKILYKDENNNYICKTDIIKSDEILESYFFNTFIPNYYVNIGDKIEISKYKIEHNKKGILLKAEEFNKKESFSLDYVRFMLSQVKGISKKTSEKIVKHFGNDIDDIIKNDCLRLKEAVKIKDEKCELIKTQYLNNRSLEEFIFECLIYDIPINKSKIIFEEYKSLSSNILKKDTYRLTDILTFKKCDEIAKELNYKFNNIERIKAAIKTYLKMQTNKGNVFMYLDDILNDVNIFIKNNGCFKEEINKELIIESINNSILKGELKKEKDRIYLSYYNYCENMIVEKIKNKLNDSITPITTKDEIIKYINKTNLGEQQKQSVLNSLDNNISIIAGGAGTGKTTIVKTIVEILEKNKKTYSLLSPTGKAAQRLKESTLRDTYTIHRKLGITMDPDDEINEITDDFVIIDETSMVDLDLFYKLISNISENTRVCFIGDYNQLPSVGCGCIFKDIIESGVIKITKLTEIYRQDEDSLIYKNSNNIINGINDFEFNNKDFVLIEEDDIFKIQNKIIDFLNEDNILNIQVLTPIKSLNCTGSKNLNKLIQDKVNQRDFTKKQIELNKKVFRQGDKVIQTVNNYDIEMMNGDTGTINQIEDDYLTLIIDSTGEEIKYTIEQSKDLDLAYSLTIHKSQGSEFDTVIIPLHSSNSFMNTKELIYTGITRAREKIILIGQKEELSKCLSKVSSSRNSFLNEKLKNI